MSHSKHSDPLPHAAPDCGCTRNCCASSSFTRRDFLKLVGLSSAGSLASGPLLLGTSSAWAADFDYSLIPANKNLDPAWVASLFARGTPTVVTGADLDRVGMPVGGICCGQLYLSGDGRLWYWDIFNSPTNAMLAGGGGDHYVTPFDSTNPPVKQGFVLKIGTGAGAQYRKHKRGRKCEALLPDSRRAMNCVVVRQSSRLPWPRGRVARRHFSRRNACSTSATSARHQTPQPVACAQRWHGTDLP